MNCQLSTELSNTVLLKGVNSLEHLLEETVLHLHINHKDLATGKTKDH